MLLFALALIVIMGFFVIPFIADKLTWRTAQEEEWVKAAMANLQRAISDKRTALQ
jgi:fatty acid desaturase